MNHQTEHKDHALKSLDPQHPDSTPYTEALEHAPTHQTVLTQDGSLAPFPTAEFPDKLAEQVDYGPGGIRGLASNPFVFGAAFLASLGGFSFGYDQVCCLHCRTIFDGFDSDVDQGVISVINV